MSRGDRAAIEARWQGEMFTIEFSQGHRRVYWDPDELEKQRKERSWASAFENRPSENFTLRFLGTEHAAGKTWHGTQNRLEGLVQEIVRTAFQLVPMQVGLRKERELAEANARRAAEERVARQRRADARAEQLKQAFLMAETDANISRLKEFLDRLDKSCSTFRPPFDERGRAWLKVVRQELEENDPMEQLLVQSLSLPSWRSWPPDWWPDDCPPEGEAGGGA